MKNTAYKATPEEIIKALKAQLHNLKLDRDHWKKAYLFEKRDNEILQGLLGPMDEEEIIINFELDEAWDAVRQVLEAKDRIKETTCALKELDKTIEKTGCNCRIHEEPKDLIFLTHNAEPLPSDNRYVVFDSYTETGQKTKSALWRSAYLRKLKEADNKYGPDGYRWGTRNGQVFATPKEYTKTKENDFLIGPGESLEVIPVIRHDGWPTRMTRTRTEVEPIRKEATENHGEDWMFYVNECGTLSYKAIIDPIKKAECTCESDPKAECPTWPNCWKPKTPINPRHG